MPNQNPKVIPSRRKFIVEASAIGATALLGGIVSPALAQSKPALRIGLLNSFSGVFAALGNDNLNGMNLYFDEIGGSIAGRKIQILKEDDEIKPQVGLQKLRKLVESDKCDIITGIQSSGVAMAAVAYLRQSGAFMLCSGAGATSLSMVDTKLPYFFRCSINTIAIHRTFGDWYYKNVAKEALLTASDFVGGRDTLAEFKSGFAPLGGKVVSDIYPPLGNNDFSPYLATIRKDAPPGTFNFYAGTDAVRFVKQYAEYGLKKISKLTGSGFMLESDTLPAQGASALGALSSLHYAETLDNAANKKFVADYRAKYKKYPSVYSEYGYVAAQILHGAIEAVHGDTHDKDALRKAMLALRLQAPRGPFHFSPTTQSPIQNVYIREVVELNGRFTNKVLYTYPNVV
ncbi:ABC transporter substrate-binding protein [Paralcaligenes ureilyticus]|uniref:Amino acid/amide ABC transporter substrate-binding protein (HAAT family) n=1 Tax=Paralcaligenes ureilyticus TaxID=627131 RepID=A0A4R3M7J0_9BURK|nr:ABC transporter substrate-binding protein [Paralcaligenes ureilyticus]TCT09434.1 amino acid/amide ABC transporter substrate-binding protein (HAAT family) [Paralcaligenes ureilyticus]